MTDVHAIAMDLAHVDRVGVDTETTGLHPYSGDVLRGISLAYEIDGEMRTHYIPVTHPDSDNVDPGPVLQALARPGLMSVYHNGIFDWHFLAQFPEFRRPARYRDTQILSWLHQENGQHTLKGLGSMHFGIDAAEEQKALKALFRGRSQMDVYKELRAQEEWKKRPAKEAKEAARVIAAATKKSWDTLTYDDIEAYARKDAELTLMLADVYGVWVETQAEMGREDVRPAIEREHEFQHTLFGMVRTGVRIDVDRAEAQLAAAEKRLQDIKGDHLSAGVDIDKNRQVSDLIYDEWGVECQHFTPKGAPSVARAALEELEGAHAGVDSILEYRRLQKAVSTYYRPLLDCVGDDGRIHSAFSSTRTVTGRLSSSNPNLMNIPRGDTLVGVRDVFVAEPGLELWEYDLQQAELRVASHFCQEHGMMNAILEGRDLHDETAARVFGPQFTGLQRRLAKNLNFGFPYGIGPRKFASYMVAGTGKPVEECASWRIGGKRCGRCHVCQSAAILDGFRKGYPDLTRMMDRLAKVAEAKGYLPLHVPGRYRRFRGPGVQVPYYTALNAIVQGGVAEFMKDIMLAQAVEDLGWGRLVLQIHDALVFEVVPGAGPKVLEYLNTLSDEINEFHGMPMPFDSKRWDA